MLRKLIFVLLLLLVIELSSLVWLTHHIGLLPTMGVTLVGTLVGASVTRRQGGRAFRAWQSALAAGEPPAAGALDTMLIVASGVLFALPGLVTDVMALLLLWRPARGVAAGYLRRWMARHVAMPSAGGRRAAPGMSRRGQVLDTEGEAVADSDPSEPPRLPREGLH